MNKGFIGKIVLIIIAIILLKIWFDFDILKWFESEQAKSVMSSIKDFIVYIWDKYLLEVFQGLFNLIKSSTTDSV